MRIFSIKNEKLNFFNRPIYCESAAEALSYVQNILMSDSDRALSGLKDDLALYELGSIDFNTGSILFTQAEFFDDFETHYAGDIVDYPYIKSLPVKVCSLRDIFDTIPADKLRLTPTKEQLESCLESLSNLSLEVKELFEKVDNLEKTKKGSKK